MVKKAKAAKPKPITRTSSMERTVREAQLFLDSGKKKKILKTITMAMTIAEGTAAVKTLGKRVPKKKLSTRPPKRVVAGSKIPTKPAKRSRAAKPAKPARAARSSKSASAAPASVSIVASGAIGDLKKTIFKAPSKDNLPLPAFGFIDVCFCVDATGSMVGELAQVQSTIVAIIQKISNKVRTEGITLRFAIVTYRDHPPQQSSYVTQYLDFTSSNQAIQYVKKLTATGGGDEPEAVHDGLLDCCQKLNWVNLAGTPMLRYIFHVLDAPPHGKEFMNMDAQEGCTCGKTTAEVIHQINVRQIHYRMIKVRTNIKVDEMEKIFQKNIGDFQSVQIANAKEMDVRVSDMIIHEIMPS